MRLGLFVLCTAACNPVFGLDGTRLDDTRPDLVDAPPHCPDIGSPLIYTSSPRAVGAGCLSYVPSELTDLAVAQCSGAISEGSIDVNMMVAATLNPNDTMLDMPRLAPEGDRLYVRAGLEYRIYERSGGAWTQVDTVPFALSTGDYIGAPTRSALGPRILVYGSGQVRELDGAKGWSAAGTYSGPGFGFDVLTWPSLSPDGLRMVFTARTTPTAPFEIYAAERSRLTDPFTNPRVILPGATAPQTPYLTDNCRLYYTSAYPQLAAYVVSP